MQHRFLQCLAFLLLESVNAFHILPQTFGVTSTKVRATLIESAEVTLTEQSENEAQVETNESNDNNLSFSEKVLREDALFETDSKVSYWRKLKSEGRDGNLRIISNFALSVLPSSDPRQRALWTSFLVRTGFFTVNAVAGNLLAERRGAASLFGVMDISFRVVELIKCYEQELSFIKEGRLKYPWDYVAQIAKESEDIHFQWNHRQSNPMFVLGESLRLLREAPAILERRTKFQGKPSGSVPPPPKSGVKYPRYYLNDFHYQTDGWLSAESAQRYEMSSETIFLGSQDVMQRQTILPLTSTRKKESTTLCFDAIKGPSSILEVACGTGRFSTFVRDHFPAANITLTDLSPFYLAKSKENDQYWREFRGRASMKESTGVMKSPLPALCVQANAEVLPFPDESFDVVMCVYLFHELPSPARRNAAQEMARVVKPGGVVVLSDSIQNGDREAFDGVLDNFAKFNEPHYISYQREDIPKLFTDSGLICDEKYVNSRTKTLSFTKPLTSQA